VSHLAKLPWVSSTTGVGMTDVQRSSDLEVLARMAARIAGCDPDKHARVKLGDIVAFDDVTWRYPDFLLRAENAYIALSELLQPWDTE
jgi:hypothetical protein